jgi:hypothetical protein
MSSRPRRSKPRKAPSPRRTCELSLARWLCVAALTANAAVARAEVPAAPDARGREFRVDFSARHLEVDAELGELSLSGDVVVTVGRYRLGGDRVRLQRGPRGITVRGGGDIAFCACEAPPVTLGYSSVTLAPPSDVIIEHAVLRAGGIPLFWSPYLWLRSPDRAALIFPSVEWRGDDGLLLGSGFHLPFAANQGRPAARALDVGAFGYLEGGARVDARLLTPQSTSFVRWDHLDDSALSVDAHAAVSGESGAVWAYDVDASRGSRGRASLTSLEAAARRYDQARVGVGSSGASLFALGVQAASVRGDGIVDPLSLGPLTQIATGGALGKASSYGLDMAAASWLPAGEQRTLGAETRAIERGTLESSLLLGPTLLRVGGFEQGEWLALPGQGLGGFRLGAGAKASLPLLRRFTSLSHVVEPAVTGRIERRYWDGTAANLLVASGGIDTTLGGVPRGGAVSARLAFGVAGEPSDELEPVSEATLGGDTRLFGLRLSGVADPRDRAAEATARLRLGARTGTTLTGFAEARTDTAPALAPGLAGGDVLPRFHELSRYDRAGLTTGGELAVRPWSALLLGGGADVDAWAQELLGVHAFARYRHDCGCFAIAAFGSSRVGRAGFDAGLSLDLMP